MANEVKLKVREIHAAYQVLFKLTEDNEAMPSKAAYWVARLLKRLEPEFVPAENARVALFKELGEGDSEGNYRVTVRLPEFLEKWAEIASVDSDIVPLKIKIETLDGVKLTPQQMIVLDKFIEEA